MGCFHNLHNKDNKARGNAFFKAGHFGMAAQFYQQALEELQKSNVYQSNQQLEIDELQKILMTCKKRQLKST